MDNTNFVKPKSHYNYIWSVVAKGLLVNLVIDQQTIMEIYNSGPQLAVDKIICENTIIIFVFMHDPYDVYT